MTVLTMGIMETFQNKRTKTIKELRIRSEQNRWRLRHLAEFKRFKSLKKIVFNCFPFTNLNFIMEACEREKKKKKRNKLESVGMDDQNHNASFIKV